MIIKPPVGLVAAGGFKKLALHVGALYRYFEAEKERLVPHPSFAIGSSAGAIALTSCLPWTEENFKAVADAILNLKKSDIYSVRHRMELVSGFALAGSFLSLLHLVPTNSPRWKKLLIEFGRVAILLGAEGAFFWEFLKQPSLFSNQPLQQFFHARLNFKGIWNSDICFEVPAVDIHTGEEYIFELGKNRNHVDRNNRLAKAVLASATLPAYFPLTNLDGHSLVDAAILNNVPIHRALLAGCETILVLFYSFNGSVPSIPDSWVEVLTRSLDISINEITRKTLLWHVNINQDLAVTEGLKQDVIRLKEIVARLQRLTVTSEQKEVQVRLIDEANRELDDEEERLKQYAFCGKKLTTIIPVMSPVPIPEQYFRKFDQELMRQAMEIGYAAMDQTLRELRKA